MKKSNIILILFISSIFLLLSGCSSIKYETSRDRIIVSPNKSYSLTLRYDNVSRPFIFKDGELIYEYKGSGFTETVYFNIKWISDDEILLYLESPQKEKYSKEEYHIKLKK